ncbi:MAG: polysaccharide biosynthesis C-terminal domain-containing protein [Chlamydiia bacterium]|nr:polysaccharide biosynthesis C-terminal domain-containing protein [Chlamydiia bacterium]
MGFFRSKRKTPDQLTRYPTASLRELAALALPFILTASIPCLLSFIDRFLLKLYSQDAQNAATAAISLCWNFQLSLIMIALVSQAFVGHYKGAKQEKKIGPFIWQMIFFSFLSMAFTYPLSFLSEMYLKGTEVEKEALHYFRILAAANFLYPLGATLASFYTGRGKLRLVFFSSCMTLFMNFFLDYLLIFGVRDWISPMGVKGAAIATVISEGTYCLLLYFFFIQKKHILQYRTDKRSFNPKLFWEGLKTGLPRALGRIMAIGAWTAASRTLLEKGGDYVLAFSFGIMLFTSLTFISDGMGQALTTTISHSLGQNASSSLKKSLRTASCFVLITSTILAIPLLLMKDTIINYLSDNQINETSRLILMECCSWIWLALVATGVNRIGVSMMTASRDTVFYAFSLSFMWITQWIPTFIGIGYLGWSPAKFFLIDSLNTLVIGVIFTLRFFKEPYRRLGPQLIRINLSN